MKKYIIIVIAIFFTGCYTQVVPPKKTYTVSSFYRPKKVGIANRCESIKVLLPKSGDDIMTKNIIYIKGFEKNSYYFSKWFDTPSQMLNEIIYKSIKEGNLCRKVFYYSDEINSEYLLSSDIIDFYQIFEQNRSFVRIRVVLYLFKNDASLKAQKEFVIVKKSYQNNALGAVKAFNQASYELSQKIVIWLKKEL